MTPYIYKWTKIKSVFAIKGCEHIENGIIKKEDLMQTVWTPLNFDCPPVNFLLRKNHTHEVHMTSTFFNLAKEDWLKRLGQSGHVWNEFHFDDETKTQSARLLIPNDDKTTSTTFTYISDEQDTKGIFKL